jgi:DNA polymerase-3 subunit alpha
VQFIPDYIKGKNHPESISYPHEDLKAELSKTFGIMVYQEQAMFLARKMGNLSWLEVDKLRGAISKKKPKEFEASCNLLRERALKRGYDNKVIDYTLKLMEKFGGYAFNRSHSCVYSILSYWGGFFRYYYPAEWLASCMQVDHAKEDSMVMYKKECRNEKIKVINPNVNDSGLDTTVTEDGAIALPLTTIKGVGNDVSKTIVLHQPFDSMWDFVIRARPNRGMVESLADSGALDCFVEVRKMHDTIEIMDYYDKLVEERNNADKKAAKEARMKYKVLSPMNIGASSKTQNNSIFKRNLPKDLFGE